MKITFILPGFPHRPSGGSKIVYEIANQLVKRGHQVYIVHPLYMRNIHRGFLGWLRTQIARVFKYICRRVISWIIVDHKVNMINVSEPVARQVPDADVVSLHCPLTPETEGLINAASLAHMKPAALLINTGRGPLLDEAAVAAALHAGQLGGLAADVLSSEPPRPDNPLLGAPRTIITPHQAWATLAARQRLLDESVANVRAFLAGESRNVVNAMPPNRPTV